MGKPESRNVGGTEGLKPAQYYPPCTRHELVIAPMLGWNHAGKLLSYAINAKRILEYGSGGSTLWLAQHCPKAWITSVEHDKDWFDRIRRVRDVLHDAAIIGPNVTVLFGPPSVYASSTYVKNAAPFDLIFIDGAHEQRTPCLKAAYDLLADGGVVILDNSEEPAYQEGKTFLLSQPGMSLIEETEDDTWNPDRCQRTMWIAQKHDASAA